MSSSTYSHCNYCGQRRNNPSYFQNATAEKADHAISIDSEVLRADKAYSIFELRNQRAVLDHKLNALLPAVDLPQEVLTIIFEFACCSVEDEVFQANFGKPSSDNEPDNALAATPLLIARVCSAWRSVVLGASQLWTNVTIYYEDKRGKKQAQMLKYWLSKSGERPLNVQLMRQGNSDSEVTQCTAVIEVLVTYGAHRLHTLNTFLPAKWESAMVDIANHLPLLTNLTLDSSKYLYNDDPSMERVDMFANAPQLRNVTLVRYDLTAVSLPWAQLESLESPCSSVSECVDTLRLCPCLRRFVIDFKAFPEMTQSVSVTHSTLEVLQVSGYDETPLLELFRVLELPALRSFKLWLSDYSCIAELCDLPTFLLRVAGTLESLYIPCAVITTEGFLETLRVIPKLRKLVLLNSYYVGTQMELTQKELDLLNPKTKLRGGQEPAAGICGPDESSDARYLLPNLKTFEYTGEIYFTPHALVEFLVARWRGLSALSGPGGPGSQTASEPAPPRPDTLPTRLRSVKFKTPELIQFEDADAEVIQNLRLEGMHLEFHEYLDR